MAAALGLVALGILNRGSEARAAHRLLGLRVDLAPMVELSASSYATNKVVKSCGAAGLLPFLGEARRRGQSQAKVTAAYVSIKLAETISLCALIAGAVLVGIATGGLHGAVLYGAMASLVYALFVSGTLYVLASSPAAADAAASLLRRAIARCRSWLHRPQSDPAASAPHELVDALARLRSDPTSGIPLLLTAIVGKIIGVACLALILSGFGAGIALSDVLVLYTLTLMASMIGPLPAGFGAAEASLAALLMARGVPAPTAAATVIAFRLLDLWLPLLAGAWGGLAHSRRVAVERRTLAGDLETRPTPAVLPNPLLVPA